jgi:LemA protein
MQHEKSKLTEITELRAKAISGNLTDDEKVELNNKMSKALHSINVAVENYPDLKANTNFLQLQAALNEIEEQLSAARRAFNAAVNSYNNAVQMFPTNIIALIMGFKSKAYFEIIEAERQNVNVKDLFSK